jgi:hypothetical protein
MLKDIGLVIYGILLLIALILCLPISICSEKICYRLEKLVDEYEAMSQ